MTKSEKIHNGGEWTLSRFNSFIKGGLRQVSHRWPPKYQVKKEAWRERGIYLCAGYGKRNHKVPLTVAKKNNVFVDHIDPVIDPKTGFVSWDDTIKRMFVEREGLQVLCKECHERKTADERKQRTNTK